MPSAWGYVVLAARGIIAHGELEPHEARSSLDQKRVYPPPWPIPNFGIRIRESPVRCCPGHRRPWTMAGWKRCCPGHRRPWTMAGWKRWVPPPKGGAVLPPAAGPPPQPRSFQPPGLWTGKRSGHCLARWPHRLAQHRWPGDDFGRSGWSHS